jgi:hypothetical protein
MIAVKRLQSVLWVLLVTFGALMAYMVSLRVATERNELNKVRAQIAVTRSDIRYLETEFGARASLRQLERWNQEDFRYSTPTASQYLNGERELAHLEGIQPNGPAYVAPPVMLAMAQGPADQPKLEAPAAPASPAPTQVRSDIALIRVAKAADNVEALASPKKKAQAPATTDSPVSRKAERMAMLEDRLLDSRTLSDITAKAAREKRKEGR